MSVRYSHCQRILSYSHYQQILSYSHDQQSFKRKIEKEHELEVNPDPEPSSPYPRAKKKKSKKKKKRRKHRKDDSSDPSSSDDSDSSDDIHYRRRRCKKKKHRKKNPIKLCANLTAKLLTTAYKSKTIRFKMDEDPLQSQIYFLTFVELLEMIFSQYIETCEVLLDYPKIGGDDIIEDFSKKAIMNLLHANIDVHSKILFAEFPRDGIKCIEKLQSHCANVTFSDKSRHDRNFQQVTHKGGESAISYIKRFQNAHASSVLVGNSYSEDQLMHTFLYKFEQDGKYSDQITSHQAELRREEKFIDKKSLKISSLQTDDLNIDSRSGFDRDSERAHDAQL